MNPRFVAAPKTQAPPKLLATPDVVCRWGSNKGENCMADQSLDARRMARDQESRLVGATAVGLNMIKPILQFQVSLLRLWAASIETFARNCENGLEAVNSKVEQQSHQQRAA